MVAKAVVMWLLSDRVGCPRNAYAPTADACPTEKLHVQWPAGEEAASHGPISRLVRSVACH